MPTNPASVTLKSALLFTCVDNVCTAEQTKFTLNSFQVLTDHSRLYELIVTFANSFRKFENNDTLRSQIVWEQN